MEERNNVDIDTTKVSPVDTRRFEAEDDAGHIKGSHQAENNEQRIEELRKKEDEDQSEYNKLDDREAGGGTETV